MLGIVAGATHRIASADWDLLRQTGTTHLLAISGLNVAMVAAPGVLLWPWLARILPRIAAWPLGGLLLGLVPTELQPHLMHLVVKSSTA